jgi:hypothetical protein
MKKLAMLAVVAALFPVATQAEGLAVSGKVGSLGLGLELTKGYSDSFSTRLGFNAFNYNTNTVKNTVNYDFKLQMQTFSLLGDWYPMQGAFRATTGLYYNNNQFSLTGKPTGGTFTVGGTTYAAADVGSMNGSVSFNKIAPYIGLGWGNPTKQGKGWGLVSDFGVLVQGQPTTTLDATCGPAIAGTAQCTTLQNDVAIERAKLSNSLSNFKLYPVATIGVSYQW